METKLFKESDMWDTSGNSNDISFSLQKNVKHGKKNKKRKRKFDEMSEESNVEAGKWVKYVVQVRYL